MAGKVALDTTVAIRYLNNDAAVVAKVTSLPTIVLPLVVTGELLYGAENSARSLQNLARYLQFIQVCRVVSMGRETATTYSKVRYELKRKGRPIPENDIWIAAQCLEQGWTLVTDDQHFTYVANLSIVQW
jgi:tRNA(fMet)-specific endonuclease VapC